MQRVLHPTHEVGAHETLCSLAKRRGAEAVHCNHARSKIIFLGHHVFEQEAILTLGGLHEMLLQHVGEMLRCVEEHRVVSAIELHDGECAKHSGLLSL